MYRIPESKKKLKVGAEAEKSSSALEVKRELVLEKSPKWAALSEVLQEIERRTRALNMNQVVC